MNRQVLWIWLSLACTPGNETFGKLISHFHTAEAIFSADKNDISDIIGANAKDLEALSDKNLDKAEEIFEYCTAKNIGIVNYCDSNFPLSLRSISTPPVLLYYRGKFPDFSSSFSVSIVGTRRLSDYGLNNSFSIARDLAGAGATIVSGMAIGIDGVAHAGALSAGGITVAVLGSGIDVCYPIQHKMLAREIVKNGCVITEYAPGTAPERNNFPKRNRIISGLSVLTLVIEGKEKSGALLTARHAQEQGRALYALPGNVGNPNSELTNLLIKNGAKLCVSADDIIRDYEAQSHGILNPFLLANMQKADPYQFLRAYSVSAVTQNDSVFRRTNKNVKKKKDNVQNDEHQEIKDIESLSNEPTKSLESFDGEMLKIYKRIPQNEECTIESLVDSDLPLRNVMKALLKLEMGRFVVMLPNEKVKRKI